MNNTTNNQRRMNGDEIDHTLKMIDMVNQKLFEAIRNGKKFICGGIIEEAGETMPFHFAITDCDPNDKLLNDFSQNSKLIQDHIKGIKDANEIYRDIAKANHDKKEAKKKQAEGAKELKVDKNFDGSINIKFE